MRRRAEKETKACAHKQRGCKHAAYRAGTKRGGSGQDFKN